MKKRETKELSLDNGDEEFVNHRGLDVPFWGRKATSRMVGVRGMAERRRNARFRAVSPSEGVRYASPFVGDSPRSTLIPTPPHPPHCTASVGGWAVGWQDPN